MNIAMFYEPIIGQLLTSLRIDVLKLAKLDENKTFLDCCCGAGGMLKLAPHTNKKLFGIDLSMNMLKQAKKNASYANLCCADATVLPFKAKSFDVSSVCMALHAIPITAAYACVNELVRVSKSVIIADYCLLERNAYLPSYALSNVIERLVGGEHYQCYKEFMHHGALEGFLHRAGYTVATRKITLGGCAHVVILA